MQPDLFKERALTDPALQPARAAIERLLQAHEPYPALAIDCHWSLLAANQAVMRLMQVPDPTLMQPPINVLRLSLHPGGLAPQILNLGEWREHLFFRLRRQIEISGDATIGALLEELKTYPGPAHSVAHGEQLRSSFIVPLRLAVNGDTLSFISTTTVFGTPVDVTLSELAIEAFFQPTQRRPGNWHSGSRRKEWCTCKLFRHWFGTADELANTRVVAISLCFGRVRHFSTVSILESRGIIFHFSAAALP